MALQVETFAGTGVMGHQNGPVYEATFDGPLQVAITPDGTMYVAESGDVRKIKNGSVTTIFSGVGSVFTSVTAIQGVVYVLEAINQKIWRLVEGETPIAMTISGVTLNQALSIRLFDTGTQLGLYVANAGDSNILKITIDSAYTGTGVIYQSGVSLPWGLLVNKLDYTIVYFNDGYSISLANGSGKTLLAGSITESGSNDGSYSSARFGLITDLTNDGNDPTIIYVCDRGDNSPGNNVVRKLALGQVTTYAGSTAGFNNGPALSAQFSGMNGLASPGNGIVYVADSNNQRIRIIDKAGADAEVSPGIGFFLAPVYK
jgi:hypothetical protein